MGRNPKFSKEVKIKVCAAYKAGKESYMSLAKSIGVSESTVREWYSLYKYHGENAFESSDRNASYTREFKQEIIEAFISGKHSSMELGGKYKISVSMVRKWVNLYNNGIEIKDYDPKGVVYTMKSRKTTFKERLEITKWVLSHDMSYKEAADRYAIKYALVYQWVQKYLAGGEEALRHKKRGPKAKQEIDESSLDEVERLKLELEREKALRERAEFRLKLLKKKEEFEQKLRSRK